MQERVNRVVREVDSPVNVAANGCFVAYHHNKKQQQTTTNANQQQAKDIDFIQKFKVYPENSGPNQETQMRFI
jgi:hypothetical protein